MSDNLAQARLLVRRYRRDGRDHRALALLAHPGEEQPERLGRHRPALGQVIAKGERVEQAGSGAPERHDPGRAPPRREPAGQ